MAYGSPRNVNQFLRGKQIFDPFLDTYFSRIDPNNLVPIHIMHVLLTDPTFREFELVDIDKGPHIKLPPDSLQAASKINWGDTALDRNKKFGLHILMRIPNLVYNADGWGMPIEAIATDYLANEAVNAMADLATTQNSSSKGNEAPSTFAGWAAKLSPEKARYFLGGNTYEGFVAHLAEQASLLSKKI